MVENEKFPNRTSCEWPAMTLALAAGETQVTARATSHCPVPEMPKAAGSYVGFEWEKFQCVSKTDALIECKMRGTRPTLAAHFQLNIVKDNSGLDPVFVFCIICLCCQTIESGV